MWEAVTELDQRSGVNDGGVGLQHNSNPYLNAVRYTQLSEDPVATWRAPAGTDLASSENKRAPVAVSDPLARELWLSEEFSDLPTGTPTTPAQALDLSIVRVHEPIHAGLAERFTHYYGQSRMLSFGKTLQLIKLGPHVPFRTFLSDFLFEAIDESWNIIQSSELVQEAAAFRAQRRFLDQFVHPGRDSSWRELPDRVGYHQLIDRTFEAGLGPPAEDEKLIPGTIVRHALGDWLGEQIQRQDWMFDLLEFAFGLVRYHSSDQPIVHALPNSVLAVAAQCSDEEIAQLDTQGQIEFLLDRVENLTKRSYDGVVSSVVPSDSIHANRDTLEISQYFNTWRTRDYHQAIDHREWYLVPLFASQYPGRQRRTDTTLWDLLDGLVADTVETHDKLTRRLWLESQYEWARETPLLQMAIYLWKLRDHTLIPLIRQFMQSATVDIEQELARAEAVLDGTKLPNPRMYDPDIKDQDLSQLNQWAQTLHERTPELRRRSKGLFQRLETLGRAIHQDETDTVAKFYRV